MNNTSKFDNVNKSTEESTTAQLSDGTSSYNYNYRDPSSIIWYNSQDKVYYLTEFTKNRSYPIIENPFKEERAKDMEKIADALVGNLKDYIVVENKDDGSKKLSGSLNETQIPALINAVSSFGFKQMLVGNSRDSYQIPFPEIKDDIFIKSVSANVVVNKDGLAESLLATGVISGKDSAGNVHDLTAEFLFKVKDINSTTVSKPDLTGKKVEKRTETPNDENIAPTKFIGKYKNDIIIEKDDSFIKVGERYLEIAHVDTDNVAGRYYEVYKDEYKAQYADKQAEFTFDAKKSDPHGSYQFEFKDKGFRLTEIYLDSYGARVTLGGSAPDRFDYSFVRIFE
jgi:hypothetical protein